MRKNKSRFWCYLIKKQVVFYMKIGNIAENAAAFYSFFIYLLLQPQAENGHQILMG